MFNTHTIKRLGLSEIEALTGRVPREMKLLSQSKSDEDFYADRLAEHGNSLTNSYENLTHSSKSTFIENLDQLIGRKQLTNTRLVFDETVMDSGLIYKEHCAYKVLSTVALDLLLHFVLSNIAPLIKPISYYVRYKLQEC